MSDALTPSAAHVLALGFGGDAAGARERAAQALAHEPLDAGGRSAVIAATAFVDYTDARFADSVVAAHRAVALARSAGAPARLLAAAAEALATANEIGADARGAALANAVLANAALDGAAFDGAVLDHAVALVGAVDGMVPQLRWLTVAVLVEAALAHGQVARATELLALRDVHERPDFAVAFAMLQSVRVAIFGGDLELARAECEAVIAARSNSDGSNSDGSNSDGRDDGRRDARGLSHAFLALIAAHQDDAAEVDRELKHVRALVPSPTRWVDGGAHLVAGFALAALDDPVAARPWILSGGGGPDLHLAQVVDRALGYEILVAAAIAESDLDGAELWARRAHELSMAPSAVLAVDQADARLALARGAAGDSQASAALASERARAAGRLLEATAADMARARATAAAGATGAAIDQFTATAHGAEVVGALALRHRAAVELRRLGRRLEPRRGAGAQALSHRELEVAALAAEGFTSRHIAQSLFISERTVQVHLRRAMRALGVPTRAGLPAALGTVVVADAAAAPLTSRQRQVAQQVRAGLTNAEIAAELGISVKTVEKHVAMIFDRWGVTSRTGIARLATFAADG